MSYSRDTIAEVSVASTPEHSGLSAAPGFLSRLGCSHSSDSSPENTVETAEAWFVAHHSYSRTFRDVPKAFRKGMPPRCRGSLSHHFPFAHFGEHRCASSCLESGSVAHPRHQPNFCSCARSDFLLATGGVLDSQQFKLPSDQRLTVALPDLAACQGCSFGGIPSG